MEKIDLPKRADGRYLDYYAQKWENHIPLLQAYAERIRGAYKVNDFNIQTEEHGTLVFHRAYVYITLDDINKDRLTYLIFKSLENLGEKAIGAIQIDKKRKTLGIQIAYQDDYVLIERRGLATEIWKKAVQIMEILGIEDYKDYDIYTFVDEATKHLKEKYGNPFTNPGDSSALGDR